MSIDLNELSVQIYCAVSNWNDRTDNGNDEKLLTEQEVGAQADMAFDTIKDNLVEMGLI